MALYQHPLNSGCSGRQVELTVGVGRWGAFCHPDIQLPDLVIFSFVVSPIALGLESPPPHQGLINMLINFIQVFL